MAARRGLAPRRPLTESHPQPQEKDRPQGPQVGRRARRVRTWPALARGTRWWLAPEGAGPGRCPGGSGPSRGSVGGWPAHAGQPGPAVGGHSARWPATRSKWAAGGVRASRASRISSPIWATLRTGRGPAWPPARRGCRAPPARGQRRRLALHGHAQPRPARDAPAPPGRASAAARSQTSRPTRPRRSTRPGNRSSSTPAAHAARSVAPRSRRPAAAQWGVQRPAACDEPPAGVL